MIRLLASHRLLDRVLRVLFPSVMFLLLNGCASVSYYSQLASGQLQLLNARVPVRQVIADPASDAKLRAHLEQSQRARDFASQHLKPDGALVAKLFHGGAYEPTVALFRKTFRVVKPVKPKASRDKSSETFLVGLGLKPL